MGRGVGFLALLIVIAIGGYFYSRQIEGLTPGGTAPETAIDVVAVRNDLMAMANAERRYWATNSKYASLDDLRQNGDIHIPSRATYKYSANASDTGFKIIASYSGPDAKAPKRITVDETMAVKSE